MERDYFRRLRTRRLAMVASLVILLGGFALPKFTFLSKAAADAPQLIADVDASGDNWTWDTMAAGGPTLTLSGVTWTSTFDVPCDMTIELQDGTTNRINGTSGINLNGHNLKITGTGNLEINSNAQSGEAAGIYSSGTGNIEFGGGITVTVTSGTYGIRTQGEVVIGQYEYTGGPQVTLNITGDTAGVKANSVTIYNERVTIGCSGSGVGTRGVITGGLLSKRAITTITGGEAGIQLADPDNHKVSCNEGNLKISGTASAVMAFKIEAVKPELTTVTATAITYGQTLANSTVSGNATYNGEAVEGTWAFTNGTVAPNVSDSDTTAYEVTFTPDDNNIPAATTNITLTVNKAATTVT